MLYILICQWLHTQMQLGRVLFFDFEIPTGCLMDSDPTINCCYDPLVFLKKKVKISMYHKSLENNYYLLALNKTYWKTILVDISIIYSSLLRYVGVFVMFQNFIGICFYVST